MEEYFDVTDFERLNLFENVTLFSLLNDDQFLLSRPLTREENTLFFNKNVVEMKFYRLNKKCTIFNKIAVGNDFIENPFIICLYKNIELSEYISGINEYLRWLSGDHKNELIEYYGKYKNIEINQIIDDKWYENLIIIRVIIFIKEDGKIDSFIEFDDVTYSFHFGIYSKEHDIIYRIECNAND